MIYMFEYMRMYIHVLETRGLLWAGFHLIPSFSPSLSWFVFHYSKMLDLLHLWSSIRDVFITLGCIVTG